MESALLRERSAPRSKGEEKPEDEGASIEDEGDQIRCASCKRGITRGGERIEMNGAHAHAFKNPSGIDYTVGCFASAPGCTPFGESSSVWSFFPGYAWRIELCGECHAHLGWSYELGGAPVAKFFGLILDRLTSEGPG